MLESCLAAFGPEDPLFVSAEDTQFADELSDSRE